MKIKSLHIISIQSCLVLSCVYGFAYILGYWQQFRINPLSYLTINDLFRASIYPLLVSLSILSISFLKPREETKNEESAPNDLDELKSYLQKLRRDYILLKLILITAVFIIFGLYIGIIIIFLSYVLNLLLKKFDFINLDIKYLIIFILLYGPSYTYIMGKKDALDIIDNVSYFYVNAERDKYIGKLGDLVFTTDINNNCIKINALDKNLPIKLSTYYDVNSVDWFSRFIMIHRDIKIIKDVKFDEVEKRCDY